MAKDDNKETIDRLRNILSLIYSEDVMEKVGNTYRTKVKDRTEMGLDIHERKFKPYSKAYARKRLKLGEPVDIVNLRIDHFNGMLLKIDHLVFNDLKGVQAYINDSDKAKIGRYHAVTGAGKSRVIREWWGLSDKQAEETAEIIGVKINEILEQKL